MVAENGKEVMRAHSELTLASRIQIAKGLQDAGQDSVARLHVAGCYQQHHPEEVERELRLVGWRRLN